MVDLYGRSPQMPSRFRNALSGFSALIFFMFLFREEINSKTLLFPKKPPLSSILVENSQNQTLGFEVIHKQTTQVDFVSSNVSRQITQIDSVPSNVSSNVSVELNIISRRNMTICTDIYEHKGYNSKCDYVIANPECSSNGYFHYLVFFYCDCKDYSFIAYIILVIWLVTLFYLLGNTAADYFCYSLEKLSHLLNLAPTVAGVTLLPLGNGAPDVFASIAAFVGHDKGDVGLNSVLGGALFVTCIVVGLVSFSVSNQRVQISKNCFIRDLCFLLFTLVCVLIILLVGEVSVPGAIAYVSIYVVYAVSVAANEILKKQIHRLKIGSVDPLLEIKDCENGTDDDASVYASLIQFGADNNEQTPKFLWGWKDDDVVDESSSLSKFCYILGLPLLLTRRLTIPVVDKERWSKGYAVASVSLAPLLLAFLAPHRGTIVYLIALSVGAFLGVLAMIYTKPDQPPQRSLFPWVLGGFFMCIVWFYIVANELVSLLVTMGLILGINPSILGLTVLAWGNSMGDLMSNLALAMKSRDGVQIAISGSYAGPMFNTLMGLGLSMLLGAWSKRPISYVIPKDSSLYSTIGFLMIGLVWTLIVLPRNNMYPNKTLGIGLLAIYFVFLSFRLSVAMGVLSIDGF